MNDQQILDLYFRRSEDAITETDRAYGGKLRSLADRILRCREDTQECVSDTYFKTWETIPPQRPRHFYAYLATICRNFAFGRLDWNQAAKRNGKLLSLSEELAGCIPDERQDRLWEGKAIGDALDRFLSELKPESRKIFVRRYWYCDSIAEIAARYGISDGKVKTQLHRLRGQLRSHLEREGIEV